MLVHEGANEEAMLKLLDTFFETFIDAINNIVNDMRSLDLKYDNTYGYIVLSLRGILVQLDGMKTLFAKQNSEASQILLRGIFEASLQLIYFIEEPSLLNENNAIYRLCYARDFEKQLQKMKKYSRENLFSEHKEKQILSIREKHKYLYEQLARESKNFKKGKSWYSVSGELHSKRIGNVKELSEYLKLMDGQSYVMFYDLIYSSTSSYTHGQKMADVVYNTDEQFNFLPIHYLESSSVYIIGLWKIIEDLLLRILPFLSNHGVVLSNLDGDKLNCQKALVEEIRRCDSTLSEMPLFY